jgi:protein SCO1
MAWCAALLAAVALAAGCASDDDPAAGVAPTTAVDAAHGEHAVTDRDGRVIGTVTYEGGVISPVTQAPPLALTDVDGEPLDIRALRGSPVLVTFVFATCPDVCPLIMSTIAQARRQAGAAGRDTRVIAVSVDPEGDTPAVVRSFLERQRVRGFVRYAVGSRPELEAVWADWGVATQVPRDDPELIEHTALTYGVNASGELVTAYPVGFDAAAVARELPRLARS